jgi:Ca2+-binding EF-hand superfamily protein
VRQAQVRPRCHLPNSAAAFLRADFKRLDKNDDRVIDAREARLAMVADFKASDVNHDGVITLRDVQISLNRARGGRATGSINRYLPYDTNHNGRITRGEYVAAVRQQMFKPMDSNHDGRITLSEALSFHRRSIGGHCR